MPEEKGRPGCAGWIIAGVVAFVVIAVVGKRATDDSPQTMSEQKTTARLTARNFVLNQLISPATAKFGPEWETEVEGYGDSWVVVGWVDSQNVYGALIRQHYRVTLKPIEDGRWRASEVLIVDRPTP